jgi:hypothetical protein
MSVILKITNFYVTNFSVLNSFSHEYKNEYQKTSVDLLKKYINIPRKEIITDLITNVKTWDIFAFSSLFLHIICSFYKIYKPYIHEEIQHIFTDMIHQLSDNIHPIPSKRNNIETLLSQYNILCQNSKWNFVNSLPMKKMTDVFIELSK